MRTATVAAVAGVIKETLGSATRAISSMRKRKRPRCRAGTPEIERSTLVSGSRANGMGGGAGGALGRLVNPQAQQAAGNAAHHQGAGQIVAFGVGPGSAG